MSSNIVTEYAKSKRATCKTCDKTIDKDALKVGVVTKDHRKRFDMTRWHHFHCFSFDSLDVDSVESVSGFHLLKSDDQEALKKLFNDRVVVKITDEQLAAIDKKKKKKEKKVEKTNKDLPHEEKSKSIKRKKVKNSEEKLSTSEKPKSIKRKRVI